MKLKDILDITDKHDFLTLVDTDYDIEFYVNNDNDDAWDKAIIKICEILEVTRIFDRTDTIVFAVNLSEAIKTALKKDMRTAEELFINTDFDDIIDDMENILAGNVGEKWLTMFAEWLVNTNKEGDYNVSN